MESIEIEAINKYLILKNNENILLKPSFSVYTITLNRGPVIKTDVIDLKADKIIVSFNSTKKAFKLKYVFSDYKKYNLTKRPTMTHYYQINNVEQVF
jgi:hypothetical protein